MPLSQWPKEERRREKPKPKLVWVLFDGWIVGETRKAVGISQTEASARVTIVWVPKSILGEIAYKKSGDAKDVRLTERIQAFQAPQWFAEQHKLDWEE